MREMSLQKQYFFSFSRLAFTEELENLLLRRWWPVATKLKIQLNERSKVLPNYTITPQKPKKAKTALSLTFLAQEDFHQ